jgi:8-oxo-dGTP pyrophosphatase MutT (NUDIX family)
MYRSDASELRERLSSALDPSPAHRPASGDRLAGVLIPMIGGPSPSLVFTRRTDELPRHPGEISFPGGLEEEGDADVRETALREFEEELGVPRSTVQLLGALPPVHTTVSAILVVPLVGALVDRPTFRPSVGEIAEVLEFPLARLAEVEAEVEIARAGGVHRGHAFELDGRTIWGATARILHSFLAIVRDRAPWALGPVP